MTRLFAALVCWLALAAPAVANMGDTYEQARARVRARTDVAVLEVWREKATGKVAREIWRCAADEGWSWAEAKAICRQLLNGRTPITALHHGLGWANGATLYYDAMLEMGEDGDPTYAGVVRADFEHCGPGRVRQLNVHGPGYLWLDEFEDRYTYSRHFVEANEDQHQET